MTNQQIDAFINLAKDLEKRANAWTFQAARHTPAEMDYNYCISMASAYSDARARLLKTLGSLDKLA